MPELHSINNVGAVASGFWFSGACWLVVVYRRRCLQTVSDVMTVWQGLNRDMDSMVCDCFAVLGLLRSPDNP